VQVRMGMNMKLCQRPIGKDSQLGMPIWKGLMKKI